MALDSIEGNIGCKVLVKGVYMKRPVYLNGQWRFAGFYPTEDEPREDCGAVGKLSWGDGDIAVVSFIDGGSYAQTNLFAHKDDIERTDEHYSVPSLNCFWVGGKLLDSAGLVEYVRELEQRIIRLEEMLKPYENLVNARTLDDDFIAIFEGAFRGKSHA